MAAPHRFEVEQAEEIRDVLRRKLTGEGDPVYETFTRNAEPIFQLMEAEATHA